MKIISGGQTGVDRAALDVAIELSIAIGGWCTCGRKAEDGTIPAQYQLKETPSSAYSQRTEWNVRDSDSTLVLTWGLPSGGTLMTVKCTTKLNRPLIVIDMLSGPSPQQVGKWLLKNQVEVLNVAGPRESFKPGVIYQAARGFLTEVLKPFGPGLTSSASDLYRT